MGYAFRSDQFLVKAGGFALFDAEDMSNLRIYIAALAFVSVITTLSAGIALQSLLKTRRRKDTPLRRHEEISSSGGSSNVVSMNRFDRKCITSLIGPFEALFCVNNFVVS